MVATQVEVAIVVKVATTVTESIGHKVDSHSRECTHSRSSGQVLTQECLCNKNRGAVAMPPLLD